MIYCITNYSSNAVNNLESLWLKVFLLGFEKKQGLLEILIKILYLTSISETICSWLRDQREITGQNNSLIKVTQGTLLPLSIRWEKLRLLLFHCIELWYRNLVLPYTSFIMVSDKLIYDCVASIKTAIHIAAEPHDGPEATCKLILHHRNDFCERFSQI